MCPIGQVTNVRDCPPCSQIKLGRADMQEASALQGREGLWAAEDCAPPSAETPVPRIKVVAIGSGHPPLALSFEW
eukprot:8446827-Heterocapsa_arctica.AAC.2